MEAAFALDLALQAIKEVALELGDLAATQARHVDMVALRAPFIEVLLALHVHQVEFINQTVAFEQSERAIDGDSVNARIEAAGLTKNLSSIKVLLGGLHDAENRASLVCHAQTTGHQFGLKASGSFGLR